MQLAAASWYYLSDDSIALTDNVDDAAEANDGQFWTRSFFRGQLMKSSYPPAALSIQLCSVGSSPAASAAFKFTVKKFGS
jgi:hypothetical protein